MAHSTENSMEHSMEHSSTVGDMESKSDSHSTKPTTYAMNDLSVVMYACHYAAVCHTKQRRKDQDKSPYINHPIEVANFLTFHGVTDRDTICGAVLHDVVEDTDGTEQDIKRLFNDNVAKIVMECSDDKDLHKIQRKRLQITHAAHISDQAKLVKLADKYSNISGLLSNPPSAWSKEEITGYVYWGMAVCRNLYGVNKLIDNELNDLFKRHGIDVDMAQPELDQHLEDYYKRIDKSE